MKCTPLYRTSGKTLKQSVEKGKAEGYANVNIIGKEKNMYYKANFKTGKLAATQMPTA